MLEIFSTQFWAEYFLYVMFNSLMVIQQMAVGKDDPTTAPEDFTWVLYGDHQNLYASAMLAYALVSRGYNFLLQK